MVPACRSTVQGWELLGAACEGSLPVLQGSVASAGAAELRLLKGGANVNSVLGILLAPTFLRSHKNSSPENLDQGLLKVITVLRVLSGILGALFGRDALSEWRWG